MASDNATIAAGMVSRWPVFASVDAGRLALFVADARLMVPVCLLPASIQDLALMYKAGYLASASPDLASSLATGSIKRQKDGDVEIEYQATGTSSSGPSLPDFNTLYNNLVRAYVRNSPRVLGYRG